MGITTFTGPVRSDNGFQEWNGSEWVPVAGGDGGSSAIIVTGGETYTIPAGAAPGTAFTFLFKANPDDENLAAIITADASYGLTSVGGTFLSPTNDTVNGFGGGFPITFIGYGAYLTFYYLGIDIGFYGPVSRWTLAGVKNVS